jgi:WD40 repeat protein
MTSAFISYSRKDTAAARKLTEAFKTQKWDFWIDWEGIPPSVDWRQEIEKGIEESGVFVFLISPDSVHSTVCKEELGHAVQNGKRLIPIVVRDVGQGDVPPELSHLNWIFCRETDDFQSAFEKLVTAINTDYDWVRTHRELQVKALEWDRNHREDSFLLRGKELHEAELQLVKNSSKEPYPTSLQREYVYASRRATDSQKRAFTVGAVVVAVALLGLGIISVVKAGEATTAQAESVKELHHAETAQAVAQTNAQEAQLQSQIALTRQLSAQGFAQAETRPDLGMLLARESINLQNQLGLKESQESLNSLLSTMLGGPRPLAYLRGHTGPVLQVAVSADSQLAASASADGTIRIWDLPHALPVFTLSGHVGPVNSIDFMWRKTPYLLASGGTDGTIRLWQWTGTGKAPQSETLDRLAIPVYAVAFSPTANLLAVGAKDKTVRVYDLLAKKIRYTLSGHAGAVTDLAFTPDGTTLASSDDQTEVRLWDMATGELTNQPKSGVSGSMHLAFSPASWNLTGGFGYNSVVSYKQDPGDLNDADILVQHTSAIFDLAYNQDGTRFADASEDWRIGYCYIRVDTCDAVLYLKAHDGPVNSVAFSPDDKWLVSGGEDGNVLLWNALFPYLSHSLASPRDSYYNQRWNVEGLAFGPDGKTLASSNWDNTIRLWDVESRSIVKEIPLDQGTLGLISISPDGKKLAVAAGKGPHYIWNADGTHDRQLPVGDLLTAPAFSPDGKWLATSNNQGKSVCLWSLRGQEDICQTVPYDAVVTRLVFSPNSTLLASDAGSKVLLWDVTKRPLSARLIGSHAEGQAIFSLAFSPDGKQLASGGSDYTIQLWDLQASPVSSIPIRTSGRFARSVAFSPDGSMLVSANEDWTVRWWDAHTGQPLVAPVQVRSLWRIDSVAFSPDGKWVATGSFDGIIDVWPGNMEQWKSMACRIAGRNLTRAEYARFIDPDPETYDSQYAQHPTCPGLPVE